MDELQKLFLKLGGLSFLLLILLFGIINLATFSNNEGTIFTCFDETGILFEIEQTNDFFQWINGYNKAYVTSGVRVVSKDGTKYFCSENWKQENLK